MSQTIFSQSLARACHHAKKLSDHSLFLEGNMRAYYIQRLMIFGLIVGLLLAAVSAQPVQAGSLTVTTAIDELNNSATSTGCSLREAIVEANAAAPGAYPECGTATGSGADTITFDDNFTITLDGSQLPAVTSRITIEGKGTANTILQASACDPVSDPTCSHNHRVFEVTAGGVLNLVDLTVRHGRSTSSGGGIFSAGRLTIINSRVISNTAQLGGGIFTAEGILTLDSTVIGDSDGANEAVLNGGGIYNSNSHVFITNGSTVSDNLAGQDGGGIYNSNGNTDIIKDINDPSDNIVANNQAGRAGGGIYNTGWLTMIYGEVNNNNAAADGGGIYNLSTTEIRESRVENNQAQSGSGGGIYNFGGLTMVYGEVHNNYAETDGGGIYNLNFTEIRESRIENNQAQSGSGGGIYTRGDLYSELGLFIIGNQAFEDGGGIYSRGMVLDIRDGQISDNQTTIGDGGGIYSNDWGGDYLENTTIANNVAAGAGGGVFSNSTTSILGSTIRGNSAAVSGGGISIIGRLDIDTSVLNDNSAPIGGGIYSTSWEAEIRNSTLSGNLAATNGGGVYYNGGNLIWIENSTISDNSATVDGGGIYNELASIEGITNTVAIRSSLITDNEAGSIANEIYNGMVVNAGDNNLFGHGGETNAQAFFGFTPYGTDISATSDGTLPTPLTDILNPILADNGGSTWTHVLVTGSPAIDAINPANCLFDTDQRGMARPQGAGCDIGAYEVDLPPAVTVEQAAGQADPTNESPILFTVTFNEPISTTTFTADDIVLDGSAPGTLLAAITETSPSDGTTFSLAVSGMSGSGTVTASMVANATQDLTGNGNSASTSTDNSVLYYGGPLEVYDPGDDPGDEWSDPITTTSPCDSTFIGEFGNQTVTLSLDDLPSHARVEVSFDLFIIRSWDGNREETPAELLNSPLWPDDLIGPDIWQLQADGEMLVQTTFSNWIDSGSLQAYPGSYPGAEYPAQTGAIAINSLCYTYGPYDMDAVYPMRYIFDHTGDTLVLDFAAMGLQDISDESWGLENVRVSLWGSTGQEFVIYLPQVQR